MSANPLATVLFVDDEERILRSLKMLFRGRYHVLTTSSGSEAVAIVKRQPVHVIVSDQRMPEMLGVEVLRRVREASPQTMRLLLTGYSDLQAIVASVNDGEIFRFIEKPWDPGYLHEVVEQAAQIALQEFAAPRVPSPALIASSPVSPLPHAGAKLLVLDEDSATSRLLRELVPETLEVLHAGNVEQALQILGEHEITLVIAELRHQKDDIPGTLKILKSFNPHVLTIVVTQLRDSRSLIELINQGQIYRFLPKPISRELLRRSIAAALEHYRQLRATPILLKRHVVEASRADTGSLSSRLLDYWRRVRDSARMRV